MENEFVSVKEFAEMVGVSQQSIYKRLKKENDSLIAYSITKGNKTYISSKAVVDVFKQEEPLLTEKESIADKTITILTEQIETLKSIINGKDKEIESLNNQIAKLTTLLEKQQELTDQQQKLHAVDKKTILLLEDKINEKKKGFFSWLKPKKKETAEEVINNE